MIVHAAPPHINAPVRVHPDGVPGELRRIPSWVAWALDPRPAGKPAKKPYSPRTGRPADVTDPDAPAGFDDAVGFYLDRRLAGVGFVLAARLGVAALDLDGVRDPATGELDPLAAGVVAEARTFTEVSPSGRGLHCFAFDRLDPAGPHRAGRLEVYDDNRFVAVTGVRLAGTPPGLEDRPGVLRGIQARLRPPPRTPPPRGTGGGFPGGDDELLARAFGAANGPRVRALWAGRHGKPTASEALLGLAQLLAFWTGPDPARLERLLTRSPLWSAAEAERAKWESRRRDSTWGRRFVVGRAIDTCRAFYGTPPTTGHTVPEEGEVSGGSAVPQEEKNPPCVRHGRQFADPLKSAWKSVIAGQFPPGIDRVGGRTAAARDGRRRLAALCWHLARGSPRLRFFLAESDAAKLLGVDQTTAGRWLKRLRSKPLCLVRRVRHGNSLSGLASEYVWAGPRDGASPSAGGGP